LIADPKRRKMAKTVALTTKESKALRRRAEVSGE